MNQARSFYRRELVTQKTWHDMLGKSFYRPHSSFTFDIFGFVFGFFRNIPEFQLSHAFPRNLCQKTLTGNTLDILRHLRPWPLSPDNLYKMHVTGSFGPSLDVVMLNTMHFIEYPPASRPPCLPPPTGAFGFLCLFYSFLTFDIFRFVLKCSYFFWIFFLSETYMNFSFPMLSP